MHQSSTTNTSHIIGQQRHEVMFVDGKTITLYPVNDSTGPMRYHRAIAISDTTKIVLDLRHVAPQIGDDLDDAELRDIPGIVFFSLRHTFKTREEFWIKAFDVDFTLHALESARLGRRAS